MISYMLKGYFPIKKEHSDIIIHFNRRISERQQQMEKDTENQAKVENAVNWTLLSLPFCNNLAVQSV